MLVVSRPILLSVLKSRLTLIKLQRNSPNNTIYILAFTLAKNKGSLSDKLISRYMCGCFMNTEYPCACLKKKIYGTNLSLKQG